MTLHLVGLDKVAPGAYFLTSLTRRWGRLVRYDSACAIVDLAPLEAEKYSTPAEVKGRWEMRAVHPTLRVLA